MLTMLDYLGEMVSGGSTGGLFLHDMDSNGSKVYYGWVGWGVGELGSGGVGGGGGGKGEGG